MGILWKDLERLYDGGGQALEAPTAQFTDYARWERDQLHGPRRARLEQFWRDELDGVSLRMGLPYDRPRPAALSGRGSLHQQVVGGAVPDRVVQVATSLGTTPYTVLAAAFATWAARWGDGRSDLVLAASSANRAGRREHEGVVGLLGDSVLLRARLSEAVTFADLVTSFGGTLFSALDHQALPLNDVVRLLAPEMADGLYPTVLFTVVTTPAPELRLSKVASTLTGLPVRGAARNELYVVLVPRPGSITVTFEYSTDLFDAATITRWAEEFTRLLSTVTDDPRTPLSALTSVVAQDPGRADG